MRIERNQMNLPIDRESPLYKAAQGMEANFLKEMVRNMRKTVQESPDLAENKGYQLFRGMLDDEYSEKAAKTQGIGLAELIVKQVMENEANARAHGPVEVRDLDGTDRLDK